MKEKLTLVIAGNFQLYEVWKKNNPNTNSKYVYSPKCLLGYPDSDSVTVAFTEQAELNNLYDSQALKVFMENHNLSKDRNCSNCEFYCKDSKQINVGSCNAFKTPTTNPQEINECSDYQLVDRTARSLANTELQAKVTREKNNSSNYKQQMDKAYAVRYLSPELPLSNDYDHSTRRYTFGNSFWPSGNALAEEPVDYHSRYFTDRILDEIVTQRDWIRNQFNREPRQVLMHPNTYRFIMNELARKQREGQYVPLRFNSSNCKNQLWNLNIVHTAEIPEGQVTVVVPINQILN